MKNVFYCFFGQELKGKEDEDEDEGKAENLDNIPNSLFALTTCHAALI